MSVSHDLAASDPLPEDSVAIVSEAQDSYVYRRMSELQVWPTTRKNVVSLAQSLGDVTSIRLQRPKSGTSNRVVGLSLTINGESVKGLFRFEQASDGNTQMRILSQVAVHHTLTAHGIRLPRVLAFDSTTDNSLSWPYMFLEFAEGDTLYNLYYEMPYEERLSVVDEIVDFLVSLENIKFNEAGRVGVNRASVGRTEAHWKANTFAGDTKSLAIQISGIPYPTKMHWQETGVSTPHIEQLLTNLLALYSEEANYNDQHLEIRYILVGLTSMLKEMKKMKFFSKAKADSEFTVISHGEFHPANIIVRPSSANPNKWEISSVVDWDSTACLPLIMARKPPTWLWNEMDNYRQTNDEWIENVDFIRIPTDEKYNVPMSSEDRLIKQHFDRRMAEELSKIYPWMTESVFKDQAYGRGRWIRKLMRFVWGRWPITGVHKWFAELQRDWEKEKNSFK